ncbi:MAG: hypothetical protein KDI66_05995 [Xanthomonadales bacterium]|nr:hypothetical protein [Xanthomonadales bacterium]
MILELNARSHTLLSRLRRSTRLIAFMLVVFIAKSAVPCLCARVDYTAQGSTLLVAMVDDGASAGGVSVLDNDSDQTKFSSTSLDGCKHCCQVAVSFPQSNLMLAIPESGTHVSHLRVLESARLPPSRLRPPIA